MELTDSVANELRAAVTAANTKPTHSVLGIDLNEIPSFFETLPDSFDVVRSYNELRAYVVLACSCSFVHSHTLQLQFKLSEMESQSFILSCIF
ncbi:hypothetical protein ACFXTH_011596 [Malus domestica]